MEQAIIVTAALQERFQAAWAQRQVILFCAPCGCGKSAGALHHLPLGRAGVRAPGAAP